MLVKAPVILISERNVQKRNFLAYFFCFNVHEIKKRFELYNDLIG